MKKIMVVICMLATAMACFAQEEKKAANRPPSPEMTAIQTAIGLAKYGYANYSATALAEAAKILAETPVQDLDVAKQSVLVVTSWKRLYFLTVSLPLVIMCSGIA